jgi:hypothetical protein
MWGGVLPRLFASEFSDSLAKMPDHRPLEYDLDLGPRDTAQSVLREVSAAEERFAKLSYNATVTTKSRLKLETSPQQSKPAE